MSKQVVRTRGMAYSQEDKNYPLRLSISHSVWDNEGWEILHQTSTDHSITKEEALLLISVLTEAIEELG